MRSVRRNMVYTCKGSGSCVVDKKRRNQCQACRFRKCIEVKMNKYGKFLVYRYRNGIFLLYVYTIDRNGNFSPLL